MSAPTVYMGCDVLLCHFPTRRLRTHYRYHLLILLRCPQNPGVSMSCVSSVCSSVRL